MNYVELNIAASGEEAEILTALLLADWPFRELLGGGAAPCGPTSPGEAGRLQRVKWMPCSTRGAHCGTYLTIDDCNWNAAWEVTSIPWTSTAGC